MAGNTRRRGSRRTLEEVIFVNCATVVLLGERANRQVEHVEPATRRESARASDHFTRQDNSRRGRELGDSCADAGGSKLVAVARQDDDVRDVLQDVHDGVTFSQECSPGVFAVAWREWHISSVWARRGTMDLYSLHSDMTGTDETTNFHVTVSLTCSVRLRNAQLQAFFPRHQRERNAPSRPSRKSPRAA